MSGQQLACWLVRVNVRGLLLVPLSLSINEAGFGLENQFWVGTCQEDGDEHFSVRTLS